MLVTAAEMFGGKRRATQLAAQARARAAAAIARRLCQRPLHGWCSGNNLYGKHSIAIPAQVDMMGLCRSCYKITYPFQYAWKAKLGLPGYRDLMHASNESRKRKAIHISPRMVISVSGLAEICERLMNDVLSGETVAATELTVCVTLAL